MKKYKIDIVAIIIFAVLSCIFSIFFIKMNGLVLTSDISFHISRVEELYRNLKEGHIFTFIATHTFSNSGVGNFLFYPTLFLYPWVLLRFIFNPVTSFYLWYGCFLFATMVIAYYSMLSYSKSRVRSYAFALIYSLATYHIHLGSWNYVLGEFTAYTFIPLAFLGIYNILFGDSKKWKVLGIGMALLMYAHLVSVYITTITLTFITLISIIYNKGISRNSIYSLVKSALLAIILTIPQLILFRTDYIGQDISAPLNSFMYSANLFQFLEQSFSNTTSINAAVGLVIVMTAAIGWYFVKGSKSEKIIYLIGVIFFILATNTVPYELLSKTWVLDFLGKIQFLYRFNSYSSFFLGMTASLILQKILLSSKTRYTKVLSMILITFGMVALYFGSIANNVSRIQSAQGKLEKNRNELATLPVNSYVDKYNYQNIFSYLVLFGETDYYPEQSFDNNNINSNKNAQSIVKHEFYLDGKKVSAKLHRVAANKLTYEVNAKVNGTLDLPIIRYKHTNVWVNDKKVDSVASTRGTVQVYVSKGQNFITVNYQPEKVFYVGVIITVLAWITLIITTVWHNFVSKRRVN